MDPQLQILVEALCHRRYSYSTHQSEPCYSLPCPVRQSAGSEKSIRETICRVPAHGGTTRGTSTYCDAKPQNGEAGAILRDTILHDMILVEMNMVLVR